jgi:hypothetical protein
MVTTNKSGAGPYPPNYRRKIRIKIFFYQKNAEDHGRKPVGESVPAKGLGYDMLRSWK